MYNCIIFDIDGTLLDTEQAILSALKKLTAEELQKDYSFEELRFVLGIPGEESLKQLGVTNVVEASAKWNQYIHDYFHCVKVFDDMEETVAELFKKNIRMGIVTSKTKKEFSNDFLPFGLSKYFPYVVCADDTENHKPNPEPLLKFIELSQASQSKTIYIGDTKYDRECAFHAGIDFGLALWGAKSAEGINADYVFENPKQLLKYVSLHDSL